MYPKPAKQIIHFIAGKVIPTLTMPQGASIVLLSKNNQTKNKTLYDK